MKAEAAQTEAAEMVPSAASDAGCTRTPVTAAATACTVRRGALAKIAARTAAVAYAASRATALPVLKAKNPRLRDRAARSHGAGEAPVGIQEATPNYYRISKYPVITAVLGVAYVH